MNHECLIRARRGERAAVEELVTALRPRLARMAAYYASRCRTECEDLLQDAWAGLLEALAAVDPRIGDPEQYLLKYARWRLLDAMKRTRRDDPLNEEAEAAVCPALEDVLPALETAEFLAALNPTQRNVLACLLAGLTWREAGSALGCTSANIAYHVRQIKSRYLHQYQDGNFSPLAQDWACPDVIGERGRG